LGPTTSILSSGSAFEACSRRASSRAAISPDIAGVHYGEPLPDGHRIDPVIQDHTRINGKAVSERHIHRLAGTRGVQALVQLGFDARAVPRRSRYFAFRGTREERRVFQAAISGLIKPYPKRPPSALGVAGNR
jgi:hypothetical protein